MINKLMELLGLSKKAAPGAAFAGKTRAVLTSINKDSDGWYFSWYTEDHSRGEVQGPFVNKEIAEFAKAKWFKSTTNIVTVNV